MKGLLAPVAFWLLRALLAGVFLYAGLTKAAGPRRFAVDIESYQLVSPRAAALAASYLPYLEIAVGVSLLVPSFAPGGLLVSGGMLTVFTLALLSAWARGLEIRCGCFGAGESSGADYPAWVLRDFALLAVCAVIWRRLGRERRKGCP